MNQIFSRRSKLANLKIFCRNIFFTGWSLIQKRHKIQSHEKLGLLLWFYSASCENLGWNYRRENVDRFFCKLSNVTCRDSHGPMTQWQAFLHKIWWLNTLNFPHWRPILNKLRHLSNQSDKIWKNFNLNIHKSLKH